MTAEQGVAPTRMNYRDRGGRSRRDGGRYVQSFRQYRGQLALTPFQLDGMRTFLNNKPCDVCGVLYKNHSITTHRFKYEKEEG